MWKWIKRNWKKSIILMVVGYALHILIEAIVVNTLAHLAGLTLPTLI